MRIQSVVLEHHCDLSVLRSYVVDQLVADEKLTLGDLLQTCDHTESCGLTASGRTYEHQEFLILNLKVKVGNGGNATRIFFINVSE